MYEIIEFKEEPLKMKLILKKMTNLKHQQLGMTELQEIHMELLKILNLSNQTSELFEDISKTLFVISHYYQLKNNRLLLLESLHLCKMSCIDNPYIKTKINKCIDLVGNYEIDKKLITVVTTVFLIANRYIEISDELELSEDVLMKFIKTTVDSTEFKNTSFYISLLVYFEENKESSDSYLMDLFHNLELFINCENTMINYYEFMNWYLSKFYYI